MSYTIPTEQKALFLQEKQGEFSVGPFEVPKPEPGEVLVRVEAAALNPVDWKIQTYGIIIDTFPAILGNDSAGVVVELGEGVTTLAIGDRVLHAGAKSNRYATFKQYTVVLAELAVKIPSNITFDQAASIPVGLGTAAVGLYNRKWESGGAALYPPWEEGGRNHYVGQPIFVYGGSSSVGQYVLQFAKLSGFSPIITAVSPRSADLVKSLGATHVVDRNLPSAQIIDAVKAISSEPIRIVYDAISSAETQNTSYDILASGGKLIRVLPLNIDKAKLTPNKETIGPFGSFLIEENRALGVSLYGKLTRLLEVGDIKPNPIQVVSGGLAGIPSGLATLRNNEVSGHKLVVHPQETS